jgi:uncharacterized protein YndB with AHSA1/START domain
MDTKKTITIQTVIDAPVEKVWQLYTAPEHITQWNYASDDWHTPRAENDLKPGGKFLYRMEAKDGSFGFDFYGTYQKIKTNELIDYTLGDGRKVMVTFTEKNNETCIEIKFETESTHSIEMQHDGWQAILDNFKKYVEGKHHDKI